MAEPSDNTKKTASSMMSRIGKSALGGAKKVASSVGKLFTKKPENVIPKISDNPTETLGEIFKMMKIMDEDRKANQEMANAHIEEQKHEKDRRNNEIIKALTARKPPKPPKPKKEKKVEEKKPEEKKVEEKKVEEKKAPEKKEPEKKAEEKKVEDKAAKDKADKEAKDKADKAAKDKADKEAKDTAERIKKEEEVKKARETADRIKKEEEARKSQEAARTAKKEEKAPVLPSAAKVSGAVAVGTMGGKAAKVAAALAGLGITSKAAVAAIVATSAKESGLDPFKPEDGAKPWLNTLNGKPKKVNGKEITPLEYIYLKFPQLGPGGRVAKQLNMPNGVPEDYIRGVMAQGDEAWFTLVYPGGADAYKYRGRGLIQITGKSVYKAIGDIIGIDLEKNPDAIIKDFDTAARAAGAYLMNSLGQGDAKKGLAALNSLTDENALKVVIANVARGNAGADMNKINKMFDPNSKLGATTASQLEASSKYMSLGSAAASGEQINQVSKENVDGKKELNAQQAQAQQTVNVINQNITQSEQVTQTKPNDTNPLLAKVKGQPK